MILAAPFAVQWGIIRRFVLEVGDRLAVPGRRCEPVIKRSQSQANNLDPDLAATPGRALWADLIMRSQSQANDQPCRVGHVTVTWLHRPFLADPFFLNKAAAGHSHKINTCIGCNQACLDHTFSMRVASCLVNPRAAHETELVLDTPTASIHRTPLYIVCL